MPHVPPFSSGGMQVSHDAVSTAWVEGPVLAVASSKVLGFFIPPMTRQSDRLARNGSRLGGKVPDGS